MGERVRPHGAEDARRERAVEMFKRAVRAAELGVDYDADVEFMEHAIIAFADEWCQAHSWTIHVWGCEGCGRYLDHHRIDPDETILGAPTCDECGERGRVLSFAFKTAPPRDEG